MSDFLKSACPHCGQSIEYPAEGTGQIVPCPTCKKYFVLSPANPETQPGPIVIPQQPVENKPDEEGPVRTSFSKLNAKTIRTTTKNGDTPLHRAARKGQIDHIPRQLLQTEMFLVKNNAGETPLHVAAAYGHLDKVPPEFLIKDTMVCRKGYRFTRLASGELYPPQNSELVLNSGSDNGTPLHVAAVCGHADQIPKEFLKPEFLSMSGDGETVLHILARMDALELVPKIYANDAMWNLRDSQGDTARDREDLLNEWKIHREPYVGRVRAEPATTKQKEKLRYFGCTFDGNITKGQASDALDKCAKDFPEANQAYYKSPATEEQLARLQEISDYLCNDPKDSNNDPEPFYESTESLTHGEAKDRLRDWELWERRQVEDSDLNFGDIGPQPTFDKWADDYEESERAFFDNACCEILDGWQFKLGHLPTRKQVYKAWKLLISQKSNKTEFPTYSELVAALIEPRKR